MRLPGKVAIVTGASQGIGAATAIRMASEGAHVIINHPAADSAANANKVLSSIKTSGGSGEVIQADIRNSGQVQDLIADAARDTGSIDILVNNAGIYTRQRLEDITDADFIAHFTTNVQASLCVTQAASPYLGHGGRIIYLSSGLARRITPLCSVYAATKAAIEAITRCQAAELGPRGITVNAVAPGIVDTPMLRRSLTNVEMSALIRATALGRVGEPDDIARVIAFLVSDDAGWISGQVIDVDGGLA